MNPPPPGRTANNTGLAGKADRYPGTPGPERGTKEMPRYLLHKPAGNGSKDLCAEVEARDVLQAAMKIGWNLNEVKFTVFRNGRWEEPRIDSWLPALGAQILAEGRNS
jgi:hypothetical protein